MPAQSGYSMAVGERAELRLRLIHETYGPESEALLVRVGLGAGQRVVDLGCGVGLMSYWIANRVGPEGAVVGVDASPEQLARARADTRLARTPNLRFVEASVYDTGLPSGHFDVVYARLLLMHLARPAAALAEMRRLLAPGGVLVCEEIAVDSSFCEPPAVAQQRLHELSFALAERLGCDFNIARGLYRAVCAAGFHAADIAAHQPVFVRGSPKRIEELSFAEIAPRIVSAGLASAAEVAEVCARVHALTADESVVYGQSRMVQVWAGA